MIKVGLLNFEVIIIRLSLVLWRNVTQRKGEYEGLSNQSTVSHGDTIDAWNNGDILPIPLAIYTQSVSPKRLIRNLYTTLPSLFMPSAPP